MSVICYFVFVRFIYSIWSFHYQVLVSVYKEKKERNRIDYVVYLVFILVFLHNLHKRGKTYNVPIVYSQKLFARTIRKGIFIYYIYLCLSQVNAV